jgi:hypothetical protein
MSQKAVLGCLAAAMCGCLTVVAEDNAAGAVEAESRPDNYPINLGIDIGPFSGVGGSLAWRPFDHFGIRGGGHWMDVSLPSFEYDLNEGGSTGKYDVGVLYQGAYATLDFYPSKKRSLRISAGVLFNQNEFNLDTSGTIEIDGTTYNNEQVNTEVAWDDPMPYLAIGGDMFYFDDAHRWSMGIEFGVAFGEAPTTTVTNPTGGIPQADLDSLQQDFEQVFGDLEIWPILKLSVNYKF